MLKVPNGSFVHELAYHTANLERQHLALTGILQSINPTTAMFSQLLLSPRKIQV